mmetsp:Transcript_115597/g.181869  ORF Transcript_115597/g.181869 Transcript_115597/m.181869 type:complete len:159 (-) Transcript_115597:20-496(-)
MGCCKGSKPVKEPHASEESEERYSSQGCSNAKTTDTSKSETDLRKDMYISGEDVKAARRHVSLSYDSSDDVDEEILDLIHVMVTSAEIMSEQALKDVSHAYGSKLKLLMPVGHRGKGRKDVKDELDAVIREAEFLASDAAKEGSALLTVAADKDLAET